MSPLFLARKTPAPGHLIDPELTSGRTHPPRAALMAVTTTDLVAGVRPQEHS
ncbi:hypothetical protein [Ornithinimicrobium murale]|uniref:hypothetical protein n=1 Tax=Ornithinimicrobium murale TaxID=1050153 RepID=UPI0013B45D15|nr:hypothetical protein [Ornithinimicrobium murale]